MADNKRAKINPITAGATGAAVGAGIAVAATVVLKNEKARKKIKEAFIQAKDMAMDNMPEVRGRIHADKLEKKAIKAVKSSKVVKKAKKATRHAVAA